MASISCNSGAYTIIGAASILAFSLGVAAGSYTSTGTAASLVYGHPITATPGVYTLTGSSVSISRINAAPAGYLINGQPAALTVNSSTKVVAAAVGSYAYTGTVAGLVLSKQYNIGTYTLTGTATTLSQTGDPVVNAFSGSYSITGGTTVLEHVRLIGTGDYQVTGTAVTLSKNKGLGIGSRAFVIAGTPATLKRVFLFAAAGGTYTITGAITTLRYSNEPAKVLVLNSGLYTLTGQPARLSISLTATPGSYSLSGQYAQLTQQVVSGVYSVTGIPVSFVHISQVLPDSGVYSITGGVTTLRGPGPNVIAELGTYTYFGQPRTLNATHILPAGDGFYNHVGSDTSFRVTHIIADPGMYTITPTNPINFLKTTRTHRWRTHPKQTTLTTQQPASDSTWDPQSGSPGV